jgi:hypothetical protein
MKETCCESAKRAFIDLMRLKYENVSVMCMKCETLWNYEWEENEDQN